MTLSTRPKRAYKREAVAQYLEWINELTARHPEHIQHLSREERAMWAGAPAQARAHRFPSIDLDPDRPIIDYLKAGLVGPFAPAKSTTTAA